MDFPTSEIYVQDSEAVVVLPFEQMSQPPIPLKGPYHIRNLAWDDRYVDLEKSEPNGPVIGFSHNRGANQLWKFFNIDENLYHINSKSDIDVFVLNDNGELRGDPTGSLFVVELLAQSWTGFPHVVRIKDNADLYWTLVSKAPGAQISAKPADHSADQVWLIEEGIN